MRQTLIGPPKPAHFRLVPQPHLVGRCVPPQPPPHLAIHTLGRLRGHAGRHHSGVLGSAPPSVSTRPSHARKVLLVHILVALPHVLGTLDAHVPAGGRGRARISIRPACLNLALDVRRHSPALPQCSAILCSTLVPAVTCGRNDDDKHACGQARQHAHTCIGGVAVQQ